MSAANGLTESDHAAFAAEKLAIEKTISLRLKAAERRLQHQQKAYQDCAAWEESFHLALLMQAHFHRWQPGDALLPVTDWLNPSRQQIPIDPRVPLAGQIAAAFRRSRRLREAIEKLSLAIEKSQGDLLQLKSQASALAQVDTAEALAAFKKLFAPAKIKQVPLEQKKREPYREYWSSNGTRIRVGKKGADNDTLTFKLANGSDWWLHVDGYPGSHVIVENHLRKAELDQETLQDALLLALWHSQASRELSADVVVTQCKFVRPLRGGKKGQVQLAKSKHLPVHFDSERLQKLQRQLPPSS